MAYPAETTATELVSDYGSLIAGKVILTTGASPNTLGGHFVEAIAKGSPSILILAGRDLAKLQKTANAIAAVNPAVQAKLLQVDLESFQSVREAAAVVNGWSDISAIDVLVNNAGIMACDYAVSPDGHERQFAANHLGPFLFTNLIIDKILASPAPRIVNVSSDGHRMSPIRFADYNFDNGKTYNRWYAYGQSKTANMLFAVSLAEKLKARGLLALSLHPGVIFGTSLATHLDSDNDWNELRAVDRALGNAEGWSDFKAKSVDCGIATHVYAAFDPGLEAYNGAYLVDSHVADPVTDTVKPWATSLVEADRLWDLSERLVGERFTY
ncbi:hypothetical protein BJX96DRAFT_75741 [Aspergillus floccosus]